MMCCGCKMFKWRYTNESLETVFSLKANKLGEAVLEPLFTMIWMDSIKCDELKEALQESREHCEVSHYNAKINLTSPHGTCCIIRGVRCPW